MNNLALCIWLTERRDAQCWSQCLHQLLWDSAAVCSGLHLQATGGRTNARAHILKSRSSSLSLIPPSCYVSVRVLLRGRGRCVVRRRLCLSFTLHRTTFHLFSRTWRKLHTSSTQISAATVLITVVPTTITVVPPARKKEHKQNHITKIIINHSK